MSTRAVLMLVCLLLAMVPATARAGWLFGDDNSVGRSGLDLVQGFDRNTVTTVSGRVLSGTHQGADPLSLEIVAGADTFVVVLGPKWYLQDDVMDWKPGDPVTVRGSKAQGKDGRTYLLAQWITAPGGGQQLVLRSDSGRPSWSGGFAGGSRQGSGGIQQRIGGGTGGGGGMQRGR